MHPVLLKINDLDITSHGVFMIAGILLSITLALYTTKNLSNREYLIDNLIMAIVAGIIGSRISYFIVYRDQFDSFVQIFHIWDGGLISFGGYIFTALTLIALLKYQKKPILTWFDCLTPPFFLGLFMARIGDTLAGEYAGIKLINHKLFNYFTVVPVSLLESIIALFLFTATLYLYKRLSKKKEGILFVGASIYYLICRIIIDFWRYDDNIIVFFSTGQTASIILIVLLICTIFCPNTFGQRRKYENRT